MIKMFQNRFVIAAVAIFLAAILGTQVFAGHGLWLIPGFEGAKCELVGAVQMGWPDWNGYNTYGPFNRGAYIADHEAAGSSDQVYWANSDPFNALIVWDHRGLNYLDRIQMLVETQQQVKLENLDRMGDPLDWNGTEYFNTVQYQPNSERELGKKVEGEETRYTLTKKTILLVPAEIHISISIPPANDHAGAHSSGWQEGEWPNLELWFKLDFTVWNTLTKPYAGSDVLPEDRTDGILTSFGESPMTEYGIQKALYEQKGGFPIAGWVQGYLENVGPDWPEDYDDEIWNVIKSDYSHPTYKLTEKTKAVLDAKTNTIPSLIGRSIALFSSANDPSETYTGNYVGFQTILEQARVYSLVPSQVPAYFPITVQTLGTHVEGMWPGPWDIYYPAVNYRIRVIYAVYGTFTYLWTVKTSEDLGYPGWETRQYEWVQTQDPFGWLKGILNPWNLIFSFLFMGLIVIAILAIFAPSVLIMVTKILGRGFKIK